MSSDSGHSVRKVKRSSSILLNCNGTKEVFGISLSTTLYGEEMTSPNIEVALDSESIYWRTKYFDRDDNKFSRIDRMPQTKKGVIKGFGGDWSESSSTVNGFEITFYENGSIQLIKKNSLSFGDNDPLLSNSFYRCSNIK